MVRYEDWPCRLTAFLADRAGMPFVWGSNDCMLFCADAVLALTGEDLAADLRGTYSDQSGAEACIAVFGSSIEDILLVRLGPARQAIGFAGRGDIVSFEYEGRVSGGVVDETGRRVALFVEGRGLARIPLSNCRNAWGY